MKVIFNSIKGLIHERARKKINFLGVDYQEVLLTQIPEDQLLKDYGGTGPTLDEIASFDLFPRENLV